MDGIVKYINQEKGYGFVDVEGYDKSLFFHVRDFRKGNFDELKKGDVVSVGEIIETQKGHAAREVSFIN